MRMVLPMPLPSLPLAPTLPPPTGTNVRSVLHRGCAYAGVEDAVKEQEPTAVTLTPFTWMRAALDIPGPPNLTVAVMTKDVVDLPGTVQEMKAFVSMVRHTFFVYVAAVRLVSMTPRAVNLALVAGPQSSEEVSRDGLTTIRNSRNGKWRSWPEDLWRHWPWSLLRAAHVRVDASSLAQGMVSRRQSVTAAATTSLYRESTGGVADVVDTDVDRAVWMNVAYAIGPGGHVRQFGTPFTPSKRPSLAGLLLSNILAPRTWRQ